MPIFHRRPLPFRPHQLISGGQTGADQGALSAAFGLGIPVGGWMPLGYQTELGPQPNIAELYGLLRTKRPLPLAPDTANFRKWLTSHQPAILNVAGNREKSQPGIHEACKLFLTLTFTV